MYHIYLIRTQGAQLTATRERCQPNFVIQTEKDASTDCRAVLILLLAFCYERMIGIFDKSLRGNMYRKLNWTNDKAYNARRRVEIFSDISEWVDRHQFQHRGLDAALVLPPTELEFCTFLLKFIPPQPMQLRLGGLRVWVHRDDVESLATIDLGDCLDLQWVRAS